MELLTPSIGLILFFVVIPFLLWLFALVDVLRNQFEGSNEKLIWVLLIIFVPVLGSILYFLIGRKNRVTYN